MDFKTLIGLKEQEARQILTDFGYNKINTIINSKKTEKTDTVLVCDVKENNNVISLICGEFYLEIK